MELQAKKKTRNWSFEDWKSATECMKSATDFAASFNPLAVWKIGHRVVWFGHRFCDLGQHIFWVQPPILEHGGRFLPAYKYKGAFLD